MLELFTISWSKFNIFGRFWKPFNELQIFYLGSSCPILFRYFSLEFWMHENIFIYFKAILMYFWICFLLNNIFSSKINKTLSYRVEPTESGLQPSSPIGTWANPLFVRALHFSEKMKASRAATAICRARYKSVIHRLKQPKYGPSPPPPTPTRLEFWVRVRGCRRAAAQPRP